MKLFKFIQFSLCVSISKICRHENYFAPTLFRSLQLFRKLFGEKEFIYQSPAEVLEFVGDFRQRKLRSPGFRLPPPLEVGEGFSEQLRAG